MSPLSRRALSYTCQLHSLKRQACSPVVTLWFQQMRTVRTKRGKSIYADPLRRDERLLKTLEARMAQAQARLKREEEEAAALMKKQNYRGQDQDENDMSLENHNVYFWEKVLTSADRAQLKAHNIHSLDDIYDVYEQAQAVMSKPPHPKLENLEPRLRLAYEMYESLPTKLSEAARAQARSPFSSWF